MNVAVAAKSEVLVALPAWLVGELPGGEDVGERVLAVGGSSDDIEDAGEFELGKARHIKR